MLTVVVAVALLVGVYMGARSAGGELAAELAAAASTKKSGPSMMRV